MTCCLEWHGEAALLCWQEVPLLVLVLVTPRSVVTDKPCQVRWEIVCWQGLQLGVHLLKVGHYVVRVGDVSVGPLLPVASAVPVHILQTGHHILFLTSQQAEGALLADPLRPLASLLSRGLACIVLIWQLVRGLQILYWNQDLKSFANPTLSCWLRLFTLPWAGLEARNL